MSDFEPLSEEELARLEDFIGWAHMLAEDDALFVIENYRHMRNALRQVMDVGDRSAVAVAHEALGAAAEWHPVQSSSSPSPSSAGQSP